MKAAAGPSRFGAETSTLSARKGGALGAERGQRLATAVCATPAWIDPWPEKIDGALPKDPVQLTFKNSIYLALMREYIRFPTEMTEAELLSE